MQLPESKIAGVAPALAIPTESASRLDLKALEDHRGRRLCLVAVYVVETLGTKFQRHGQNEFCAWTSVKELQVSL